MTLGWKISDPNGDKCREFVAATRENERFTKCFGDDFEQVEIESENE